MQNLQNTNSDIFNKSKELQILSQVKRKPKVPRKTYDYGTVFVNLILGIYAK